MVAHMIIPDDHARASALAALRLPSTRRIAGARYDQLLLGAVEVGCDPAEVADAAGVPLRHVLEVATR
jgi:hypothetical protein